eukprot:UN30607
MKDIEDRHHELEEISRQLDMMDGDVNAALENRSSSGGYNSRTRDHANRSYNNMNGGGLDNSLISTIKRLKNKLETLRKSNEMLIRQRNTRDKENQKLKLELETTQNDIDGKNAEIQRLNEDLENQSKKLHDIRENQLKSLKTEKETEKSELQKKIIGLEN